MRRRMLFLASGLVGAVLTQAPALAAQDLNCADFPNQEAAQKEFDKYEADVNDLDRDGDKIACEWISVGGRVFIEDSLEAQSAIHPIGAGVSGLTYGNPSGARAELRSMSDFARGLVTGGSSSGEPSTGGSSTGGSSTGGSSTGGSSTGGSSTGGSSTGGSSTGGSSTGGSSTGGSSTGDLGGSTGAAEDPGAASGTRVSREADESSQSADATPWKSEDSQQSERLTDPAAGPVDGQALTEGQVPEQSIAGNGSETVQGPEGDVAQTLPHTGVPARATNLGVFAISLLLAGWALVKRSAYRPRRLARR